MRDRKLHHGTPNTLGLRGTRLVRRLGLGLITAFWFCAGMTSMAHAVVLTLLDSEANAAGSITGSVGNWSDSAQSLDLDPFVQVQQNFGPTIGANSFVNAGHSLGQNSLAISAGLAASTFIESADVTIDYDFELRFTLDEAASYTFQNNNDTGGFPRASAPTPGTTASLVYELREEGGSTVFIYASPSVGVAGVYSSGVVPAGTYLWTGVGSAAALGDVCCNSQSADITGNVGLSFQDAPPPPVPGLGDAAAMLLVFLACAVAVRSDAAQRSAAQRA